MTTPTNATPAGPDWDDEESPPSPSWEKPSAYHQWRTLLQELIDAKATKEACQATVNELEEQLKDHKDTLNRSLVALYRARDDYSYLEEKLRNFVPF